ncbi:hypothetical protein [Streptomyces sp. NPDC013455]|uniref:hypothetical protein n=1 Tax=Streptomyces sp. NPDC013455 TaxID=3155605 RepID=UPI0033EBAF3C
MRPAGHRETVVLAGGARDEYEATGITLPLLDRRPRSMAGALVDVPLPVATLCADDGQRSPMGDRFLRRPGLRHAALSAVR